jgi:hypothetical protein
LVGVVFLIWWALGSPPLVIIFLLAALVAGYYAWLAAHKRQIPKVAIREFTITPTPTNLSNVFQVYVHIIPRCETDASVNECQGFLLRVLRKSSANDWEPTDMDEPLELTWSIYDNTDPRTLRPGIPTRLNLCYISSHDKELHAAVPRLPLRCSRVFGTGDTFRFDVRVTAKDCLPADASIVVKKGNEWDRPYVELLSSQKTT